MISCIQNLVFNMLHLPFGLTEYIEYLIANLLKFVLVILHFNLNSCIDSCSLILQARELRMMINN